MKHQIIRNKGVFCFILLLVATITGAWSANQFFSQQALVAEGVTDKNNSKTGVNQVYAHIRRYKTLGDPSYNTLAEALTTIGSNNVTLTIPSGTVSVASNMSIPANVSLRILQGGKLDVATDVTLAINGPIEAGPYQIFSCTGTGKVVCGGRKFPEWWGCKADGSTDNSGAYIKCLQSFTYSGKSAVLEHQAGVYVFNSPIVNNTALQPGIVFQGQGNSDVDAAPEGGHGTVLKYTGTNTLFGIWPATGSDNRGWHWRDMRIYCSSTGSAIVINDPTKNFGDVSFIQQGSLNNVTLHGSGGDYGFSGVKTFEFNIENNCEIRGFKYGVNIHDGDNNRISGFIYLNTQQVRITSSDCTAYGNINYVTARMAQGHVYRGETRYLIYDTAQATTYRCGQIEGDYAHGDKSFYLNGYKTTFENCGFGGCDGGVVDADARDITFINPLGAFDTDLNIKAPTNYFGINDGTIYFIKPSAFILQRLPLNPRVQIINNISPITNADRSYAQYCQGVNMDSLANQSLVSMLGMGNLSPYCFLINPFTKGIQDQFSVGYPTWVADANATTGWAFNCNYEDYTLCRRLKAGVEINTDATLIITVRLRSNATVIGGNISLNVLKWPSSLLYRITLKPAVTTSYQTYNFTVPALTNISFGDDIVIYLNNALEKADGHPQLYVDYLSIVPMAKNLGAKKIEMQKISEPENAATAGAYLFIKDNGAGKSQLCVRFGTGSTQVVATEP